jgi:hypothetical protein
MYNAWPDSTRIITTSTSNGIQFDMHHDEHRVPPNIEQFLGELGWTSQCNDPDTREQLYTKVSDLDLSNKHFKWYEAIAYEWYRTMTLGGM